MLIPSHFLQWKNIHALKIGHLWSLTDQISVCVTKVLLPSGTRAYSLPDCNCNYARFRPRILIDVTHIDLSTTVLGFKISMPIMVAPTAMQRMAHPEGMSSISVVLCRHLLALYTLVHLLWFISSFFSILCSSSYFSSLFCTFVRGMWLCKFVTSYVKFEASYINKEPIFAYRWIGHC